MFDLNTLAHVVTRTRKREVDEAAVIRVAKTVTVEFSEAERAYYDSLVHQVELLMGTAGDWAQEMVLIMRERQAASCLPASVANFQKALQDRAMSLGQEGGAILVADEADHAVNLRADDVDRMRKLLTLAQRIGRTDSKFDQFIATLNSALAETPDSKVLVFSYFRGTLDYLAARLQEQGFQPLVIHGGVSVQARHEIIDRFRNEPARRILLSSEVGAEGLDFQFCDILINYDLPWNPMRIEQRIGRLDRFGQKSPRIRIFNFVIDDTIETWIFQRLYHRIRIFEQSIGDLEEILGEKVRELSRDVFRRHLSPEEQQRRADEIAEVIERRRQDEEAFDQEKSELLGQDSLLEEEVRDRIRNGNYISSEEVRALVQTGLRETCGHVIWEDNQDGTFALRPSEALRDLIISQLPDQNANDEVVTRFLSHCEPGRRSAWIPITFDQECAREGANLEFVTIRHPLARAILNRVAPRYHNQAMLIAISAHAPVERPRDAYFFLYLLSVHSVLPMQSLVAVVIDPVTGESVEWLEAPLLAALLSPDPGVPPPPVNVSEWLRLEQRAQSFVARQRDAWEKEERRRNDARLAARRASIQRFYQQKIQLARNRALTANNAKIARMKAQEAVNLNEKLRHELAELEQRRKVVASYRRFGGGVVRFTSAAPPPRLPV
ncbi:MAG: hypothetical protein KatS3mg060_0283 [Dehalococcoidia bacterium]|nr:MAG: hypothetical protein KatS3mg060_0283 [Dehalococcoidia bacterium]